MNWPLVFAALGGALISFVAFAIAMRIAGRHFAEVVRQRDYLQGRVEALTEDLLSMRRDGFSVAKPATVRESPDEEANGLHRAEAQLVTRSADHEFITKATKDIMAKTGVSQAQARAEAIRLRRAVTDEDPPT